ncbi:MAG: type IV secretion system DNA-binding domain-containing protein [Methylacidiphilales bacterium]|nr:type IV secretion system DNA-binding domain-containing protein [Candidatus Methylacidiphilales bacterium]
MMGNISKHITKNARTRKLQAFSVLSGYTFSDNINITVDNPRCILIPQEIDENKIVMMDDQLFSKHMLFVGSIGSGKTNAIFQLVRQIKSNLGKQDVMIIFDTKGDFLSEFYDSEKDIVISNDQHACGLKGEENYWNIFEELYDEPDYNDRAIEMATSLFAGKIEKTNQVFFPQAARDILAALFIHFNRLWQKNKIKFDNGMFRDLIDRLPAAGIKEILSEHEDLRAIRSYISHDMSPQTQGVISELYQGIREIFVGNFRKHGDLSIRRIVREKGGVTAFIEFDISLAGALGPIYGLIIDLAIKEALGRSRTEGNTWFILDEFRLLPNLKHIDAALNFGRSLGVKVIMGLQNINQVIKAYGEHQGMSLLSACSSVFAFRVTDHNTREFVQKLFGKQRRVELITSENIQDPMEQVTEGHVVEDWMLNQLDVGEAIVSLPSYAPFLFKFSRYDKKEIMEKRKNIQEFCDKDRNGKVHPHPLPHHALRPIPIVDNPSVHTN